MTHWKPSCSPPRSPCRRPRPPPPRRPEVRGREAPAAPAVPDCAWQPLGYRSSNVAYPDTNSQYWLLHYTVQKGLTIELDGRYPDARYASFASYDASRDKLHRPRRRPSVLTDHRIAPDRGSHNPYREHSRPGGKFSVSVTDRAGDRRNTLPLAPTRNARGRRGDGGLPRLPAARRDPAAEGRLPPRRPPGTRRGLRRRTDHPASPRRRGAPREVPRGDRPPRPVPPATASEPPRPAFSRLGGSGLYPNPDNAYVATGFDAPPPGQVLVVRGKAPRGTTGDRARALARPEDQVRYWSMCNNLWWGPGEVVANPLPDGTVDTGCRTDHDTRLAADGTYTYVVGTEEQRATVESVPGVTFLPLSAGDTDRQASADPPQHAGRPGLRGGDPASPRRQRTCPHRRGDGRPLPEGRPTATSPR
ncbi:hypothetical protein LV779_12580 [Streptomyces thinghirensis]|nr:hypothetical protein [Streptomyces thinghirensis]